MVVAVVICGLKLQVLLFRLSPPRQAGDAGVTVTGLPIALELPRSVCPAVHAGLKIQLDPTFTHPVVSAGCG